jgi:hypothetical protein
LEEWRAGDIGAADRLFPLVYGELKRSARAYLRRESRDGEHTLQLRDGGQIDKFTWQIQMCEA